MLGTLKSELKDLVAENRFDEIFRRLREEVVLSSCELHNEIILIQGAYNDAVKNGNLNLICWWQKSAKRKV